MPQSVNTEIVDGIVTHTVNLQRLAAGERKAVLSALSDLEGKLVADLQKGGHSELNQARLTALLGQTQKTIATAYEGISGKHAKTLSGVAQIEATKTVNVVNAAIGVAVTSVGLTPAQLVAISGKTVIGGRFVADHWKDQSEQLQKKFGGVVRTGMLQGKSIDDMVRTIRGSKAANYSDGLMAVSKAQATALVRTSVMNVANESRIATMRDNQDVVKGIQWVATLDARTTPICRALDGLQWSFPDLKPVGHNKAFPGTTAHWQCRSTQVPVTRSWAELAGPNSKLKNLPSGQNLEAALQEKLKSYGMDPEQAAKVMIGTRASMDGQVKTMDFGQWLGGKSEAFQDDLLGPGRAKLFRDGTLSIRQFTDQDNRPLSLKELHDMVAKNASIKSALDGQDGITLAQRALLTESMTHGIQTGKVMTHFVSETGEHFTINGTTPSEADIAKLSGFGKLTVLRNSVGTGEVWGPEEMTLFGKLPNFQQASIVGPSGKVITIEVKAGKIFTQADSQEILAEFKSLQGVKTIPQTQQKLKTAVSKNGTLKTTISPAASVEPPSNTYNQVFAPAPAKMAPLLDPDVEAKAAKAAAAEAAQKALEAEAAKKAADAAEQKLADQSAMIQAKARADLDAAAQARKLAKETNDAADALKAEAAKQAAAMKAANEAAQTEIAAVMADPKGKTVLLKAISTTMKAEPGLPPAQLLEKAKAEAIVMQAKASQASVLSGMKKKLLDGETPTPAQMKTFATLQQAEKDKFMAAVNSAKSAAVAAEAAKTATAAAEEAAKLAAVNAAKQVAAEAAEAASKATALAAQEAAKKAAAVSAKLAAEEAKQAAMEAAKKAKQAADATSAAAKKAAKQAADEATKKAEELARQAAKKVAKQAVDVRPVPTGFPDDPENLRVVKRLGGSTGAELVEDAKGNRYVRKRGANPAHIREEVLADDLYRALGVDVPEARLYESTNGPVKLARYIEGDTLGSYMKTATPAQKKAVKEALRNGLGADTVLGNWDVLGAQLDNVLVGKDGRVWRIDNGGSLRFRAMGAPKTGDEWDEFIPEMWTMRGKEVTPRLAAVASKISSSVKAQFREYFGEASIYDIARQIDKMDAKAIALAPPEVRAVLEKRFSNAKQMATRALDFEHGGWKADFTDRMTRHCVEIREVGVTGRMKSRLVARPGTTVVADENGVEWDDLRSKSSSVASAASAAAGDPYSDTFLQAVISINANVTKFANVAKIKAVKDLKPELLKAMNGTDPAKKKVATFYKSWIDKIEAEELSWKQSKTKQTLPKFDPEAGANMLKSSATGAPAKPPRASGSLGEDVATYIKSLGGNAKAVSDWMSAQAGSSWAEEARAMKYFVFSEQNKKPADFFWGAHGLSGAKSDFDALAKSYGGEEALRSTLRAWVAYTQEILSTTQLPNVDRSRRVVRLIRTEEKAIFPAAGITPGEYGGVHKMKKGANESHSILKVTTVLGKEVTVQAVPFSNITGLYFTDRPGSAGMPGTGKSAFLGDSENEITANTSNIPFVYVGSRGGKTATAPEWEDKIRPGYDAGSDATKWGVPLTHIRK